METKEKLTAREAREISEKNQLSVEKAMEFISSAARDGKTATLFSNLHKNTVDWLFNNGYTLSKHTDPFGVVFIRVEW